MSALKSLLSNFRDASVTEREKGTYFEELCVQYLRNEATYRDLYSDVWTYGEWTKAHPELGFNAKDTGIDLIAKTNGTEQFHAIQCKFYSEDHRVVKADIDSFFTASGKKTFSHRVIITTTTNWSDNAEVALYDQHPPVTKIDLNDLESSQIDWAKYQSNNVVILKERKSLRPHQQTALTAVTAGFRDADRGKLIMACGTGKTFTSLKIAESIAGKGKRVLFLVPSLSLLSQSLTEWTQESGTPLHSFAVCSDSDVGKKKAKADEDFVQTFTHELRFPATTEPKSLAREMTARHDDEHMSVVFSTYHSIDVISKAQKDHLMADFDLVICDEAHRTTGAIFETEEESAFVKIHDADFIKAAKRLYMTATPRIYGDVAKASAEKDDVTLCSMDDEALYGKEFFVITFSEAVKRGLLVDYKVLVLAVDAKHINERLQNLLADENNQIKVDDASKIIGCWKALSKQGMQNDMLDDQQPMRRAVAFCQVIEYQKGAKTHKVSSKNIANMFQSVVEAYQEAEGDTAGDATTLNCQAEHVDGSMNASQKEAKLDWLKAESPDNTCRILSNVRCLSEGVDVPALDSVLFLTPRNSQVDVVQSVGRVMRNAPGKKRGYVVLPVVIPVGVEPHDALNDNKTYKVVWQVLQALRSHDDRFDALINKLDLIGNDRSKMEVIAITDKISRKPAADKGKKPNVTGKGQFGIGAEPGQPKKPDQGELEFEIGVIERAIYAKVVQKCGNRSHWEDWAKDIADIAKTHIGRITAIVNEPKNTVEVAKFTAFANELRVDLNGSISNEEVIEMLAQHLITKPVFDALFSDYDFAKSNSISNAMQGVLDLLQKHHLEKEADTLQKFYDSVKMRAEGIESAQGKQKIVVELYDKFFRNAFPHMTERLGIVYTPVEVVDFIIHSVNDILKSEFKQTLGSDNVHIIDPFTGTGTFITRLLQSELIDKARLPHKYTHEIHANEIVLLAYYIAAINIEAVYHDIMGDKTYKPFNGICLTDTFQLHEKEDLISEMLQDNSARRKKQKKLDIRVIMGNPPYSVGQDSANDNNQNVKYPGLDAKIRDTYAAKSKATNKNALYDSYIRAIRWASDRVGNSGVIGFVTNAGFLDSSTADGMRKCLANEFSSIYVFHLRGNARTAGEQRRREKDNVFGQGTRTPIAITILVKNPASKDTGNISWHDIGDYLSQQEKLEKISTFQSINGITKSAGWQPITPDSHGDWVGQRDDGFTNYISLGDKKDVSNNTLFNNHSRGLETNRDAWCYNSSQIKLSNKIESMIAFYNDQIKDSENSNRKNNVSQISSNSSKISWSRGLKSDYVKGTLYKFNSANVLKALYRPYTRQFVYYAKGINEYQNQIPRIFPTPSHTNRVISITGLGTSKAFSLIMTDVIPDIQLQANGQCFPLYLYEKPAENHQSQVLIGEDDLFPSDPLPKITASPYVRMDGLSDSGLKHFQDAYLGEEISKEDLFYYIYGLLHSPEYRERYADNLSKELPRIPCVKKPSDFWAFTKAGRGLAELHLNYETVKCHPVTFVCGKAQFKQLKDADFLVTQMKFGKGGDKTTVIYNHKITMTGIPLEAYDYVVNGKPALEWVMERQAVTTHKASGIVNDANDWATETMKNAKYPLELFQRVITVSLETMKIVNGLPKLDIG